jgi:hypothetical protein
MPSRHRAVVINRPVSEVFAFITDPNNDHEWRSGVKEIRRESGEGLGARYYQRLAGPGGRAIPADFQVTGWDPDRQFAFQVVAGPLRPRGEYTFRPVDGGTELSFSLDAPLSGVKKLLMGRPVQKAISAEMANLDNAKRVLESRD